MRIGTRVETDEAVERGSGTEIEAPPDVTPGEMMMIDRPEEIGTYLMIDEAVVEVDDVVIEAIAMVGLETVQVGTVRRVQHHHLRKRNLPPI